VWVEHRILVKLLNLVLQYIWKTLGFKMLTFTSNLTANIHIVHQEHTSTKDVQ